MVHSNRLAVCLFGRFPEWIWTMFSLVPGAIGRKEVSGARKSSRFTKINNEADQRYTIFIKSPN